MKKMWLTMIALCLIYVRALAQDAGPAAPTPDVAAQRLRLATSSGGYPVTPGDVYRLTFRQGEVTFSNEILVESDYRLNLNVFGSLNAAGMTFAQVKPAVEKIVEKAYPRSVPSLSISSIGIFQVFIKGETQRARNIDAWGLSRLSGVIEGMLGPFSSIRNIEVVSRDGTSRGYDLFKAQRLGNLEEDPYLRQGDTIVISTSERMVEIAGEVRRPGKYQLLTGEELRDLVESFAGGLTSNAEISRVRIDRVSGEKVRTFFVNAKEGYASEVPIQDGDLVTVPGKTASLPVVFFEGAVITETPTAVAQAALTETPGTVASVRYNRISYSFREGETLSDALSSVRKSISPMANLSAAYIIRKGTEKPIPADLAALLSGTSASADMLLQPMDRIVVPAEQFSVSIYGDVARPGSYSYSPGKTYRYYADLAGAGAIMESPENIVVLDTANRQRAIGDSIAPDDRINITTARVGVNGDVTTPGRYPYTPGKTYRYYADLAGGGAIEEIQENIVILSTANQRRAIGDAIQPDDNIYLTAARVGVQGAVFSPGSFVYRKEFSIANYVNLAGGFDPERNISGQVTVFDSQGKPRQAGDAVNPGDRIYAHNDSFAYNFNRYFPLVASVIALLTSVVTLVNTLAQ
jgi:polysaccharide export outer membrane protein